MNNNVKLIAGVLFGLSVTAAFAWAGDARISPELRSLNSEARVEVIVQYKVTPTSTHHHQAAALGGSLLHKMESIRGAHYSIPASRIAELADNPDVAYVSPNRPLKAMFDQTTDGTVYSTWANSIGFTGAGVGVAVIDSGVVDLPDFHTGSADRIVYSQSFVGGAAADQYGHGTHVAGILAGNGNGTAYVGIAPQANIVNLRVLDANGQGSDAAVIEAIQTAISLKTTYNIRVINLSIGRPVFESAALDPLCQAVEAAWKAGIAVVVAAGNDGRDDTANTDGYGTITAPGNDPYAITVGSIKSNGTTIRSDDRIASYSSKGPTLFDHYVKPDLIAPGNLIVSTLPSGLTLSTQYPANRVFGEYFILSGTSMAAPVVSGTAAMLIQSNPNMTPDQVKAVLMLTSTKNFPTSSVAVDPATNIGYTSYYDIFTVGAGELNVAAAYGITSLPKGSAISPSVT